MARKPMPTAWKIITGAFDKNPQRRNVLEPEAPTEEPTLPADLDPIAAAKWTETAGYLRQMGVLSIAYGDLLTTYAQTWSNYVEAQKRMRQAGIACVTKSGGLVVIEKNPFEVALHKFADRLHRLQVEMGLTPSAKAKLQTSPKASTVDARERRG